MSTSAEPQRSEYSDPRITPYHAKYFAHELTKRCPSDALEKIAASLVDAQVDLNPHQVEAALFAFRSPLSKGALLADEVGLGKTIEAGILLSQKWAERKRKLLVIVPSNLRKQWNQELADKFFLPSVLLETRSFNEQIKLGNLNPFARSEIIICSFQFARSKDAYLKQIHWDLVIIDEDRQQRRPSAGFYLRRWRGQSKATGTRAQNQSRWETPHLSSEAPGQARCAAPAGVLCLK